MAGRLESGVGPRLVFNGRELDYFGGSGYLGLQNHPRVLAAARAALDAWGFSTATSRGGFGEHPLYDRFEQAACDFFGAEAVLSLPSGYMGPAVLVQASLRRFEHIFIDADAHYSLWDAAQAAGVPVTPFAHLRPEALAAALKRELGKGERPLVLSDGLFPVSGEIAPLPEYLALARERDGLVFLDDAHAAGVLGENGRGTGEHYGLAPGAGWRSCCTLAKALGGQGGLLWGEASWLGAVERGSRICAGTSPLPLVSAAASAQALELARGNELRARLRANTARLKEGLRRLGWDAGLSPSPVVCLSAPPGQDTSLERIRAELYRRGIAVEVERSYPSAPPGGGLRIAVFADHSPEQIERLLEALKEIR